ncbi:MAG: hypothetical protein WKF84_10755 [Pyrinomonadaceae bacterium]
MKQPHPRTLLIYMRRSRAILTEHIWETLDNVFKTVYRHARRVDELEQRITELERRLNDRSASITTRPMSSAGEMPIERAA